MLVLLGCGADADRPGADIATAGLRIESLTPDFEDLMSLDAESAVRLDGLTSTDLLTDLVATDDGGREAIVLIFGAAAIFTFTIDPVISWMILGAAVVLDAIIYMFVGKVTTCYACRAEYRKCALNPGHEGFDLATSEKY